jgi:hypothetical protein
MDDLACVDSEVAFYITLIIKCTPNISDDFMIKKDTCFCVKLKKNRRQFMNRTEFPVPIGVVTTLSQPI